MRNLHQQKGKQTWRHERLQGNKQTNTKDKAKTKGTRQELKKSQSHL